MSASAPINRKLSAGFTLVEVIISFTILTLALGGFSGMVFSGIHGFRQSQESYLASAIAQEGMELAQNKKDNSVQCITADPNCPLANWQDNLLGDFQVDATQLGQLAPQGKFPAFVANNYICILPSTSNKSGFFSYCGNGSYLGAGYTREVSITSLNSYSVSVITTVRWGNGKSLALQSILFSN